MTILIRNIQRPNQHINQIKKILFLQFNFKTKHLVIDEIYDPHERINAKLLEPYIIEIKETNPTLIYPLKVIEVILFRSTHRI